MDKSDVPVLLFGLLPKKNKVLDALTAAEKLLSSVAFVQHEGDTTQPLRQIRAAIKQVSEGK